MLRDRARLVDDAIAALTESEAEVCILVVRGEETGVKAPDFVPGTSADEQSGRGAIVDVARVRRFGRRRREPPSDAERRSVLPDDLPRFDDAAGIVYEHPSGGADRWLGVSACDERRQPVRLEDGVLVH